MEEHLHDRSEKDMAHKARCGQCNAENPETHRHCSNCGKRLVPVIRVSEDREIPETELRDFIAHVCDQHFEDREVVKNSLLTDITKEARDSLGIWLRLIETTTRNFFLVVGIVIGLAAIFGFKTYYDIRSTFTGEVTKISKDLQSEAEARRKEFRAKTAEALALTNYLRKTIQRTRFTETSTNERFMTDETRGRLDGFIRDYLSYLLGLEIVPTARILEVDVDEQYAGFPHYDTSRHRLRIDPLSSHDKDLVCRFYTASVFPQYIDVGMLCSGLGYYFPCSWQNDPVFAEVYAQTRGAKREPRLDQRNLKVPRNFNEIPTNPTLEEAGEVWGSVFWEIREKLGQADADRVIAMTARDFTPRGSGRDEEMRFVEELIKNGKTVHQGKAEARIKSIFTNRNWKF